RTRDHRDLPRESIHGKILAHLVMCRSYRRTIARWWSSSRSEECNQVGHLLRVDVLLEALGHQGLAGGSEFVDLAAGEPVLAALGASERHRGRGLLGEETGVGLPPAGGHGQDDVIGLEVLIRVDDVGKELVRSPAGDAGEVRPDAVPLLTVLVAGLAV